MDLRQLFYTIFKALNPYTYRGLAERKIWFALKYFLFIVALSSIIMLILFIPIIFSAGEGAKNDMSNFKSLNISSSFEVKEQFNLLSDPVVKISNTHQNMTDEFMIITPTDISYRRFLIFGDARDIPLNSSIDIASSSKVSSFVVLGLLFLLPSLFFWSVILFAIYFAIIIIVASIIGLIITGIFRIRMSLLSILKSAIYSSTMLVALQLILLPFSRLLLIPLIAYLILFLLTLFVWDSGRGDESSGSGRERDEIFSGKLGSGKKGASATVQDNYDVDEHGNLKGSRRKKRYSEENEGYVEL